MIIVNDLKPGTSFIYEGNLYLVLSTSLNKTAMRQMVVKAHAKDMRTGTIKDVVFTGGDKVDPRSPSASASAGWWTPPPSRSTRTASTTAWTP